MPENPAVHMGARRWHHDNDRHSPVTKRGFPAPSDAHDRRRDEKDVYVVVRLSQYELTLMRPGEGTRGKFVLLDSNDGTRELVRVTE